uniref:Uncharacterized protein n=1 Tax=Panagrolaimus superbus TaxID=310955 RepID=A0A914YTP2_9BILA
MVCCQNTLNTVAYFTLTYIGYRISRGIYNIVYPYLLASPRNLHKLAGEATWAVVTGSTDGIGKEYAFELARKGFNILLISRTQTKLDSVKEEILKECKNIEVETIAYNFTNASLDDYKNKIISIIEKKDVGILVNNVGLASSNPEMLHKADMQESADIVVINMLPVTILTSAILPQMVKRNSGIIVNISSGASHLTVPQLAVYSSSKVYINHFCNTLRNGYAKSGITIQTLYPAYVSTNLSQVKVSLFALHPKAYAQSAIKTIGISEDTTGCIQHQIQAVVYSLPQQFMTYFAQKTLEKKQILLKLEREKAEKEQ